MNRWFATIGMLVLSTCGVARAEFAIKDGDTVVFLGDSITAEGTYGRIIENYTLLRFPDRNAHFINAGWGGDTAERGLARLERDVFAKGATLVTVAFGINDIGWGGKADAAHRQAYLDATRKIVEACKARNVRVFICSAAVTGSDPDKSENDVLQQMCDDGMAISKSLGEGAIDVQRSMRAVQKRMKGAKSDQKLHTSDGIHLNELGQTAMAFAILKGLGAPAEVSYAAVDSETDDFVARGCIITNVKPRGDSGVEFDRLDEGLPVNLGLFGALRYQFIPIQEEVNRYMLSVRNLSPGKYNVLVNERGVGTFSAEQLAAGVNLSSATADGWQPGGPWEAQAWLLNDITNGRNNILGTAKFTGDYLKHHPGRDDVAARTAAISASIEELQHQVAKPAPYHFVVRRAVER